MQQRNISAYFPDEKLVELQNLFTSFILSTIIHLIHFFDHISSHSHLPYLAILIPYFAILILRILSILILIQRPYSYNGAFFENYSILYDLSSEFWKWLCISQRSNSRGGSRTAATSKMGNFVIIVNAWKPLNIITKSSILDVPGVLDPPLNSSSTSKLNSLRKYLKHRFSCHLQRVILTLPFCYSSQRVNSILPFFFHLQRVISILPFFFARFQ